jgi:transposase
MKVFRPYHAEQQILLPPSMQEWLPEGHLALFLSDVVNTLDLTPILRVYEAGNGRGQPPYPPTMMVKLLLYAYCTGRTSSRGIEEATYTDVAFRVLSANQHPDHSAIAEFRRRHLEGLAGLFLDVLKLCQQAGLVKLGHVALDGTKIRANASKHKAMSYERMEQTEKRLKEEIAGLLGRAEKMDKAEDERYGRGKAGDELPQELARRESRLQVIEQARRALEEEARQKAEVSAEAVRETGRSSKAGRAEREEGQRAQA